MNDADDDVVIKTIEELEITDVAEYRALKQLCGDEEGCSLGRLPLALVQAGAYIAQFDCPVGKYLNMFKKASEVDGMQDTMRNTEVEPIQESQRPIWTTWQISTRQLSYESYSVLQAMAMIGPGGVGEAVVKGIVRDVIGDEGSSVDQVFRKGVIEGLIHGSSLICRDERGREGQEVCMYMMHRLASLLVLKKVQGASNLWNEV